ncbi:MAG: hypothetical protein J3Q66DRAFT_369673 [Benniella sp.]|nr:MAG: hypothetical protein J3Q66DRAFT_369673 [Benniella sp.]
MTKISLLAALVLASVCSALELYTDDNFEGDLCIIDTPPWSCERIPERCYNQVSSVSFEAEWRCLLFDNDDCSGDGFDVLYNTIPAVGRSFNDKAKSALCWFDERGRD